VRASRLLQLLLLLQHGGRRTAPELAHELEVSVRTVYRDVDALAEAGIPVYAEAGRHGGVQLVDGYRTRLTGLTAAEAETLVLGGAPGPLAELGLGTVVAAAQLKVLAALPPELRGRALRIRERFHLDAPGWFHRDEDVPALPTLARALWDDRRIVVRYRRADRTVQRTLDPLGVVLKAGTWYLLGRTRGSVRTYRVSRIERVEVLDEAFERPPDFDLAARWDEASHAFESSFLREEVRARVSPAGLAGLRHALEPHSAREAQASASEAGTDGWHDVTIWVEHLGHAHDDLLRLGAECEVLEPAALREALAATAAAMAERYQPMASAR
jgi:predicted DNA-binding transcriptional regulator YafY